MYDHDVDSAMTTDFVDLESNPQAVKARHLVSGPQSSMIPEKQSNGDDRFVTHADLAEICTKRWAQCMVELHISTARMIRLKQARTDAGRESFGNEHPGCTRGIRARSPRRQ